MGGKMSRNKGKRGELEVAHILSDYGYKSRRSQQYAGINNDADVVGLSGIHIEVKRVERLNLYDAMAQSISNSKDNEKPTVFHRRNRSEWLVTMKLDDWIELFREWDSSNYLFNEL